MDETMSMSRDVRVTGGVIFTIDTDREISIFFFIFDIFLYL